jgi:hypothetical protein
MCGVRKMPKRETADELPSTLAENVAARSRKKAA